MNQTYAARAARPFTTAAPWLLGALLVWNVIRGFALHMEPYALGQYFYTYEGGFLIRGLVGSLVQLLAGSDPMSMYAFLEVFTVIEYLAVVTIVLYSWRTLREPEAPARERDNLLFLVMFSGPLMVSLGTTRGFHDALTVIFALLAYIAFQRERLMLSWILVTLATLIHEQIAFFLFPALGWLVLTKQPPPRLGLSARDFFALVAMVMATITITFAGKASPEQLQIIIDRVTAALNTPYFDRWADPYLTVLAASNSVVANATLEHFHRFEQFPSHFYLLPTTALFWAAGGWVLLRSNNRFGFLVYTLTNLLPFTILFVAYDVQRYASLATLTAFLLCLRTLQTHRMDALPRIHVPVFIVAILIQTASWNYDPVFFNARNSTPLLECVRICIDPSLVPTTRVGTPHP